jgi:hypothetical protein
VPLGKFRVFDHVRQIPELDYQFLLLFFSSPSLQGWISKTVLSAAIMTRLPMVMAAKHLIDTIKPRQETWLN